MCRAADVAMTMVNRSIELADKTKNASYYMDLVKLHNLLYLAQCYMLDNYGRPMFVEQITAHQCGPYVEGLHFVARKRGFGKIDYPFSELDFVLPSYRRLEGIDAVLEEFGTWSTAELVEYTKETPPYAVVADSITDEYKPIISQQSILSLTTGVR